MFGRGGDRGVATRPALDPDDRVEGASAIDGVDASTRCAGLEDAKSRVMRAVWARRGHCDGRLNSVSFSNDCALSCCKARATASAMEKEEAEAGKPPPPPPSDDGDGDGDGERGIR